MNGTDVLRRREAHRLLFSIERMERGADNFQKGYPAYDAKRKAIDGAWERFDAIMAGPPDAPGWHDKR